MKRRFNNPEPSDRSRAQSKATPSPFKESLLTREEEIELARQIEAASSEVRDRILASGMLLPELAQLLEDVSRRKVRVELVTRRSAEKAREPFAQSFERDLRASVDAEQKYQVALARSERVGKRFRQTRETRIQRLRLSSAFWRDVVARVQRSAIDARAGSLDRQQLRSAIGISADQLRVLNRDLTRAARMGERAKEIMVESNLRLVHYFARRITAKGVPMSDLIQEGNIGLMRAVEKFDHRRGCRFATYASWWIRQGMQRAIADQSRTIRVPVHMNESMQRVWRVTHQLEQKLGRVPTDEEIATVGELPLAKVHAVRVASLRAISFDMPVRPGADRHLSDLVEDERALMGDVKTERAELQTGAQHLLARLSPKERTVISMRFGIEHGREHTLQEIGRQFNVSRERIRQIESAAIKKLRIAAEALSKKQPGRAPHPAHGRFEGEQPKRR